MPAILNAFEVQFDPGFDFIKARHCGIVLLAIVCSSARKCLDAGAMLAVRCFAARHAADSSAGADANARGG